MTKRSKLDTADKVIKAIYFTLYVVWNVFVISVIVYTYMQAVAQQTLPENGDLGYALTLILFGLICGAIGNLVISAIALIGLICATCNKRNPNRPKTVGLYVLLILLPIITEALIVLGGLYMPKLLA